MEVARNGHKHSGMNAKDQQSSGVGVHVKLWTIDTTVLDFRDVPFNKAEKLA